MRTGLLPKTTKTPQTGNGNKEGKESFVQKEKKRKDTDESRKGTLAKRTRNLTTCLSRTISIEMSGNKGDQSGKLQRKSRNKRLSKPTDGEGEPRETIGSEGGRSRRSVESGKGYPWKRTKEKKKPRSHTTEFD